MKKVLHIAWREFVATVATKGFLFGVLVMPVLFGGLAFLIPVLFNEEAPKIDGEIAISDPTGEVTEAVRAYLEPEAIAGRRDDVQEKIREAVPESVRKFTETEAASKATQDALAQALGEIPVIDVVLLAPESDLEEEKKPLLVGSAQDGGRLAVVQVHPDAVVREPGSEDYGSYDLFVREKLDDRIVDEIRAGLRVSIGDARIRNLGLSPEEIRPLTRVSRVRPKEVTEEGERGSNEIFNQLLPMAFMLLLFVSSFTSGQQLLTTTIEEKSSRVVEVLLSAVSPMQLMTGKILGQLGVGLLILGIYSGVGVAALVSFALLGLVDLSLLVYLFIFFLIAYFFIGALMAAIGAAVNEIREAQNLMTPLVLVIVAPWMLWLPISRDPNSVLATVLSFIPPVNSFVMMLRLPSNTPPPGWQIWLSIAVGIASVFGAMWLAAKVFRVGLLMHGKPPNFRTLLRWVRMA